MRGAGEKRAERTLYVREHASQPATKQCEAYRPRTSGPHLLEAPLYRVAQLAALAHAGQVRLLEHLLQLRVRPGDRERELQLRIALLHLLNQISNRLLRRRRHRDEAAPHAHHVAPPAKV